jgi:excisionase family DNA binding protein
MPEGYYTTKEAAEALGLSYNAIRDAIRRGTLRVDRSIPGRNLILEAELERYRKEHLQHKGWAKRKAPGYVPDETRREYQRAYRRRKREAQGKPGRHEETHNTPDDAPAE